MGSTHNWRNTTMYTSAELKARLAYWHVRLIAAQIQTLNLADSHVNEYFLPALNWSK